jgi:hypothetical protein
VLPQPRPEAVDAPAGWTGTLWTALREPNGGPSVDNNAAALVVLVICIALIVASLLEPRTSGHD